MLITKKIVSDAIDNFDLFKSMYREIEDAWKKGALKNQKDTLKAIKFYLEKIKETETDAAKLSRLNTLLVLLSQILGDNKKKSIKISKKAYELDKNKKNFLAIEYLLRNSSDDRLPLINAIQSYPEVDDIFCFEATMFLMRPYIKIVYKDKDDDIFWVKEKSIPSNKDMEYFKIYSSKIENKNIHGKILLLKAFLCFLRGNKQESESLFKQLISDSSHFPHAYEYLGLFYKAMYKENSQDFLCWENAARNFLKASQKNPELKKFHDAQLKKLKVPCIFQEQLQKIIKRENFSDVTIGNRRDSIAGKTKLEPKTIIQANPEILGTVIDTEIPILTSENEVPGEPTLGDGEQLGVGAFGVVKKAKINLNGKVINVAEKIPKHQNDELIIEDLLHEIRIWGELSKNPKYFAELLGVGFNHLGQAMFYMPLYQSDLSAFIKKPENQSQLNLELETKWLIQIGTALCFLHNVRKMVHLDIKAENILLDSELNIKITDFGETRECGTPLEYACGTPWYMSPEMLMTDRGVTSTNHDMWSVGVLIAFILSRGIILWEHWNKDKAEKDKLSPSDIHDLLKEQEEEAVPVPIPSGSDTKTISLYQLAQRCLVFNPVNRIKAEEFVYKVTQVR